MRVKTRWHDKDRAVSLDELAGLVAFTAWKLADRAVDNLHKQDYTVAAGPQAMLMLAEFLIFEIMAADRLAWLRLEPEDRTTFTTTLANRLGELLREAVLAIPGVDPEPDYKGQFIARVNRAAEDYASFGFDENAGPDWSFRRNLGSRLLEIAADRDQSWIIDQAMDIEAPEIWPVLKKVMDGALEQAS